MRAIGIGTSAVAALVVVGVIVVGVRSVPDMQRYLRMRRM